MMFFVILKRMLLVAALAAGLGSPSFADFYVIPINKSIKMKNIVTVAESGGEFTDIESAIDSITDASALNPYAIFIAAGTYTITDTIELPSYIHLVGSGRDATRLIGDKSGGGHLLRMSAETSASNLSVLHHGGTNLAAIFMQGSSISLDNVYAYAEGGTTNTVAIYAYGDVDTDTSASIHNCKIYASSSGTNVYAIQNSASHITIRQSELKATDASSKNYAVYTGNEGNTYIKSSQLFSSSSTQGAAKSVVATGSLSYNGVMFSELETVGESLDSARNSCFYTMKSDDPALVLTYRYAKEDCTGFTTSTP